MVASDYEYFFRNLVRGREKRLRQKKNRCEYLKGDPQIKPKKYYLRKHKSQ